MQPTRIGGGGSGDAPRILKPTSISNTPPSVPIKLSEADRPQITPSVINPAVQPARPVVAAPSGIPGAARKRILISVSDIMPRCGNNTDIAESTKSTVESIDQDRFTTEEALTWGQSIQDRHLRLTSFDLELAQNIIVTTVTGHLDRLIHLMSSIHIDKVFGEQKGVLGGLLRKTTKAIDTRAELDGALREIELLRNLLQGCIQPLIAYRAKLEEQSKEHTRISDEIETSLLAAEILAAHLKKISRIDTAQHLESRVASLTVTLGHIRSNSLMRQIHIEQPTKLTTIIQDTVFNTLSAWMMAVCTTMQTLRVNQTANPTEIRELSRTIQTIIEKLKP